MDVSDEQPDGSRGSADGAGARGSADGAARRPVAEADDLAGLRRQVEAAERKVAGEFEPSGRLVVASIAVCAAMVALLLPHTGDISGLDILFGGHKAQAGAVVITSKIFVWLSLVFAVIASGAALLTRRWIVAVIAGAGCGVGTVFGLLSVWSRNTTGLHGEPPSGVGVGLLLGWLALAVLTVVWVRTIWERTGYLLALEAERRATAQDWERDVRERTERFRNPGA